MSTITITLTAYNMGPQTTEADFDAWRRYVCDHVDDALNVSVDSVDQHSFTGGPAEDTVTGGTEEQREAIRSWLAHEGRDAFCAKRGAA